MSAVNAAWAGTDEKLEQNIENALYALDLVLERARSGAGSGSPSWLNSGSGPPRGSIADGYAAPSSAQESLPERAESPRSAGSVQQSPGIAQESPLAPPPSLAITSNAGVEDSTPPPEASALRGK